MSRSDEDKLEKNSANHSVAEGVLAAQPWLKQAVTELRQPVAPAVAGQLHAARRVALAQDAAVKQSWLERLGFTGLFAPGMALAAGLGAVAIAVMLIFGSQTAVHEPQSQMQASSGNALLEDLSIIAAQDDLQFYQDLELMQWLAQEDGIDLQG